MPGLLLICVSQGSGGGPTEDHVTGILVRSIATQWAKGSIVAVDAGTHLAGIIRILEKHLPLARRRNPSEPNIPTPRPTLRPAPAFSRRESSPAASPFTSNPQGYFSTIPEAKGSRAGSPLPQISNPSSKLVCTTGPFKELMLPYESAKANAAYLLRNVISTYLITHPHLDHISGFTINTASFNHTTRPKKLAALPSTIDAIKTHIFNDVVWPNMSDEENGIGLVSYMRLHDGGNVALGDGEGKGYIEICEGLAVKCWSVSHGCHASVPVSHRPSTTASTSDLNSPYLASRRSSSRQALSSGSQDHSDGYSSRKVSVESSAFFIRDDETGKEVLIFGDVEPDSISLTPRTERVWSDAAPKIASGLLVGIFIECSYDDTQSDETLFGHLAPRHLMAELCVLADKVLSVRRGSGSGSGLDSARKRKRQSNGLKTHEDVDIRSRRGRSAHQVRRKGRGSSISPSTRLSGGSDDIVEVSEPSADMDKATQEPTPEPVPVNGSDRFGEGLPLKGLKVIIIHVKDTLSDGMDLGQKILADLGKYEKEARLGCEFVRVESGGDVWL